MSEVDDRLSHAKKLLKKYQSKYQQDVKVDHYNGYQNLKERMDHEHPCNISLDPEANSFAPSRNSSCPSSTCNDNKVSHKEFLTPETLTSSENAELAFLRKSLWERDQSLSETANKLQLLHTHYSELYEAYNLVNQSVQSKSLGGDQVSQLQTALAVAIEEKTSLQFELRDLFSRLASIETENRVLKESQKEKTAAQPKSDQSEQLKQLNIENARLVETISNQSVQIEKQRKECSNLEAKIMVIQQDRNETQARLKHFYEEKNTLENDIEQMRNDLNMKEIYIRQLTRNSQADSSQDQLVIKSLTEERKKCVEEVEQKSAEIAELKKQASAARDHFESCLAGVNDKFSRLQVEAEELKTSKAELGSAKSYLEEQLRLLRINLEKTENLQQRKDQLQGPVDTKIDFAKYEALQNSFDFLQEEYARNCNKYQELEKRVEQKNTQIESLKHKMYESNQKIALLEEARDMKSSIDVDVSSLLEQLQNEKATVSRAVGQNLELKEQLKELQDKFILITNESARKEIERTSAYANLAALQQHINRMQNTSIAHTSVKNTTFCEHAENTALVEQECQTDFAFVNNYTEIKPENQLNSEAMHTKNLVCNHSPAPSASEVAESEICNRVPFVDTESGSTQEYCYEISKIEDNQATPTALLSDSHRSHASTPNSVLNESTLRHLEQQLEKALNENSHFRITNERLQHWLTALETENESIGEYVALYRYQRSNIQKRINDSEVALKRSRAETSAVVKQLTDLQSAVMSFAKRKIYPTSTQQSLPRNLEEVVESCVSQMMSMDEENSIDTIKTIANGSSSEITSDNSVPNDQKEWKTLEEIIEIIGRQQQSIPKEYLCHPRTDVVVEPTIHCTGCAECRGEMFTL